MRTPCRQSARVHELNLQQLILGMGVCACSWWIVCFCSERGSKKKMQCSTLPKNLQANCFHLTATTGHADAKAGAAVVGEGQEDNWVRGRVRSSLHLTKWRYVFIQTARAQVALWLEGLSVGACHVREVAREVS